jgi:hypothetical protein
MNEQQPLLDRIRQLERTVLRWRLATFVLAILLVCSIAIGGTMSLMTMLQLPDRREMLMIREEERAMREQAEAARREALAAAEREKQARQQAEQALREAEAARKQGGDGP